MPQLKGSPFLGWLVLVSVLWRANAQNSFTLPCDGNLSSLPRVSAFQGPPAFDLSVSHPTLDAENGIIPGVVYQVTLHEVDQNGVPFKRFLLRAMSNSTTNSDTYSGNFTAYSARVRPMPKCNNNISNSVLTNSDFSEKINISTEWEAPSVFDGCIIFRASVIDIRDDIHDVAKQLCSRTECYKFVRAPQGAVVSPGFPAKYGDSLTCLYFLQVPQGFVIKLQFQMLDLEPSYEGRCYDYVSVASEEKLLARSKRLCGKYQGAGYSNLSFVSDGNFMVIKFVSDDKIAGQGFRAVHYAYRVSGCFVNITGMSGNLSSVNYPAPYFPLYSCTYFIKVPSDYHLALTFTDLDLPRSIDGGCADYVIIETADNPGGVILCGDLNTVTSSLLYYESHSDWMRLKFVSDYMIEGRGFLARFSAVQFCLNQTYSSPNGTVTSVNYPEAYLNLQECYIYIEIPDKAQIIDLQFVVLNTEAPLPTYMRGDICTDDFVEVNDGLHKHKVCGDWTGQEHKLRFRSSGPKMLLRFVSNSLITAPGFKAMWRSVPKHPSTVPCRTPWSSFEESCIWVRSSPMTWPEAQEDCQRHLGHLVHITNQAKQQFVASLLQNSSRDPSAAFWIGASDALYEGEFFWTDGSKIDYTNWFPGWPAESGVPSNRQPNDDGLSQQDCVELRQLFVYKSKGRKITGMPYWNDRECSTKNYYVCERTKEQFRPLMTATVPICDLSIFLNPSQPNGIVVSPGFPGNYESFLNCNVNVSTSPGYVIEVTFHAFDLEDSMNCQYDALNLRSFSTELSSTNSKTSDVLYCGNWTSKLKLLRYKSEGNVLHMKFLSDHSKEGLGYHAKLTMRKGESFCPPGWKVMAGNCFNSDTQEVDQNEAMQLCENNGSHLPHLHNEAELYILRNSISEDPKAAYWTGIVQDERGQWRRTDGSTVNSSSLLLPLPGSSRTVTFRGFRSTRCVVVAGLQSEPQSTLHLRSVDCQDEAQVLCIKSISDPSPAKSIPVRGLNGTIRNLKYPTSYDNNVNIIWTFSASPNFSIIFIVKNLDLEYQDECLYDFLLIGENMTNSEDSSTRRFCGNDTSWYSYAVHSNYAFVQFVSDYSVTRKGLMLDWRAVDVSHCDTEAIMNSAATAAKTVDAGTTKTDDVAESAPKKDVITLSSPNFPYGYLNDLHCRTVIRTSPFSRIFVTFTTFRLNSLPTSCADYVILLLDSNSLYRQLLCPHNSSTRGFLSLDNYTEIIFHSDDFYNEVGFEAKYYQVSDDVFMLEEEQKLFVNQTGQLHSLNWPLSYPAGFESKVRLRAPTAHVIAVTVTFLALQSTESNRAACPDILQIIDEHQNHNNLNRTKSSNTIGSFCSHSEVPHLSKQFTSYLNEVVVRFSAIAQNDTRLPVNGLGYTLKYSVIPDPLFVNKTRNELNILLDKCDLDTCHNNATCLGNEQKGYNCNCSGPYRGLLCAFTFCDSSPCRYGAACHNLDQDYNCTCPPNYGGKNCELNTRYCALTNCRGHGQCYFQQDWQLTCSCNGGWSGDHCEEMTTVLGRTNRGSRLLEEPFWIGIIVVLGVLAVTGLMVLIRKNILHRCNCNCCMGLQKTSSNAGDNPKSLATITTNGHDILDRRDFSFSNAAFSPGSSPVPASTPLSQASPVWDKSSMPVIKVYLDSETSRPVSDMEDGETSNIVYVHHSSTPPEPPPSPSSNEAILNDESYSQAAQKTTGQANLRRSSSFDVHVPRPQFEDLDDTGKLSSSLDAGMAHPPSQTSFVTHDKNESAKTLSVDSRNIDSEERGSEHYRVNSAQRRKEFVNSVRRARYQSIIDNDQPKSNHSSGSLCRSCGSCCSYQSFESDIRRSSNESRHALPSLSNMKDTFSMSVDVADTTRKSRRHHHHHHRKDSINSDDGVFLHRTSSRTSDASRSSRHCHHRSHHHHKHRSHHRSSRPQSKHYGFEDWHFRESKRRNDYTLPDVPQYSSRDSRQSSRSDILANRPSSYGDHLKLSRTISRDWSSEYDINLQADRYNKGAIRKHRKVQAVHSDGSASSARSYPSTTRAKQVIRKVHSVDIREIHDHPQLFRHKSFKEHHSGDQSGNSSDEMMHSLKRIRKDDYSEHLQVPSNETTMSDLGDSIMTSSDASPRVNFSQTRGISLETIGAPVTNHTSDPYFSSSDQEAVGGENLRTLAEVPNAETVETPDRDEFVVVLEQKENGIYEVDADGAVALDDRGDVWKARPPKSSPELEEDETSGQNDVGAVDCQVQVSVSPPNKHPLGDSAYQSKEQSTEKSNSTAVSPTLSNNGFRPKEDVFTLHKPLPSRMEDKRVTNQLELAARKLVALREMEERSCSTDETNDAKTDLPIVNGCLLHADNVHPKTKVRLTLPSRMLSMIADEEYESSNESDRGRSRPSLMSSYRSFEDDGAVPLEDMTVQSAASLSVAQIGFLFEEHSTEV